MSQRKGNAIGAIIIALADGAWIVASNFSLVSAWLTNLQRHGGLAANVTAFVTNPVFDVLTLCAALLLAFRAWKAEPERMSETPLVSSQNQANPQSQSVTINNYPGQPQHQAPAALPARSERPQLPRPNVRFLSARKTTVRVIEGQHEPFFAEAGIGQNVEAILAGFRNESIPGMRVSDVESARTQILYYGANEKELASIFGACWLNERSDLVDLTVGDTFWLVIAVGSQGTTVWPYYRTRPADDGFGGIVRVLEQVEFDEIELQSVEVRIIDQSNHEVPRLGLDCRDDENGKPTLLPRG